MSGDPRGGRRDGGTATPGCALPRLRASGRNPSCLCGHAMACPYVAAGSPRHRAAHRRPPPVSPKYAMGCAHKRRFGPTICFIFQPETADKRCGEVWGDQRGGGTDSGTATPDCALHRLPACPPRRSSNQAHDLGKLADSRYGEVSGAQRGGREGWWHSHSWLCAAQAASLSSTSFAKPGSWSSKFGRESL